VASWPKQYRGQSAKDERPARTVRELFEDFLEFYGHVEREAERAEIALGGDIINRQQPLKHSGELLNPN
jgi:hypothetical protein